MASCSSAWKRRRNVNPSEIEAVSVPYPGSNPTARRCHRRCRGSSAHPAPHPHQSLEESFICQTGKDIPTTSQAITGTIQEFTALGLRHWVRTPAGKHLPRRPGPADGDAGRAAIAICEPDISKATIPAGLTLCHVSMTIIEAIDSTIPTSRKIPSNIR